MPNAAVIDIGGVLLIILSWISGTVPPVISLIGTLVAIVYYSIQIYDYWIHRNHAKPHHRHSKQRD